MAVEKLVLLYRLETWVLTPRMKRVLVGFHHSMDRRLTGKQPWKGRDRGWVYSPLDDAVAEAGLQKVESYVSRRQKTVAQYIVNRPIVDLCLAEKRMPGPRVKMWWWEQEGLDFEGMRTAAW